MGFRSYCFVNLGILSHLKTKWKSPKALKSVFIWKKTVPFTGGKLNFICRFLNVALKRLVDTFYMRGKSNLLSFLVEFIDRIISSP